MDRPLISVIVPARDASATLPRTLAALAEQDLDQPYEVVVVDDGSADATAALAAAAPGPVTVVEESGRGPGPARNSGVAAASGEVLAFTDADCYPAPDWLRRGLEAIDGADLVQGRVIADPGSAHGPFDRSVTVDGERGLYETANLIVRRPLFEELGGFEDWLPARIGKPLAEDLWLGWRARRAGARTAYAERALVHHAVFERGPADYVAERARLVYFPAIAAKMPELRDDVLLAALVPERAQRRLRRRRAGRRARRPVPLAAAPGRRASLCADRAAACSAVRLAGARRPRGRPRRRRRRARRARDRQRPQPEPAL